MSAIERDVTSRMRVIAALGRVRNDSEDCACDGCLVDAALTAVVLALLMVPDENAVHAEWSANFIKDTFLCI